MSTQWSEPDYLGQSMNVTVIVQNLGSVPLEVQSVTVSFDWNNTLSGNTPRILQAGEKSRFEIDNVRIPSTTWTGEHSFFATVMGGWADSAGGWSNTLSSPVVIKTNFGVQEATISLMFSVTTPIPGSPSPTEFLGMLVFVGIIIIISLEFILRSKHEKKT